jgi:glycosyltransferase involved in cell wall biosynthesis
MPSSLRIAMMLQYYLPHRTGLTLHVARLADGLARRGHRVTVVAARHLPSLPREETNEAGVRILRLPTAFHVSRGVVMPSHPRVAARLANEVDVLHLHAPLPEAAWVALLAMRRRTGLVLTHHGDLVLPGGPRDRVIEAVTRRLFDVAARRAFRIIAYSEDYRQHSKWLARWRNRCEVIRPPVSMPVPDPARVAALRKQLCSGGAGPVVGFAGRFVQEKRPELLVRALDPLREAFPDVRLAFAGAHELEYEAHRERHAGLLARHADRLQLLGLIEAPEELSAFYAACDVLALPSDTECMGLVQPEAMLAGTPVVASDVPGGRDPVRSTGMGTLVTPGDPRALAAGVARVLSQRDAFVVPRSEIAAHFDLDDTLDRTERVLFEAAEAARG